MTCVGVSFWGIDVVISSEDEEPVVVDLNMARPNGNHFPLILAERLRKDAAKEFAWVLRKVSFPDCDPTRLVNELRQAGMLTDKQGVNNFFELPHVTHVCDDGCRVRSPNHEFRTRR